MSIEHLFAGCETEAHTLTQKGMGGVIWQTYWVLQTTNLISSFIVSFKTHPPEWLMKIWSNKIFRRNFGSKMGHITYTYIPNIQHQNCASCVCVQYASISIWYAVAMCLDFHHSSCVCFAFVHSMHECVCVLITIVLRIFHTTMSLVLECEQCTKTITSGKNSKPLFGSECYNEKQRWVMITKRERHVMCISMASIASPCH